jgi:glycerophosphoryl diester phosphodiesterase
MNPMMKRKGMNFSILVNILFMPLIVLMASGCFTSEKSIPPIDVEQPAKKIDIIGHRGAAGLVPENTISAFQRACEIGVDAIELDVLLTADNNIVVHHDYALKPEIDAHRKANGWTGPAPP